MEARMLVEGDGMSRVLAAVDLSTTAAVVTAFKEGEGLLTRRVITSECRSVGLN
jgi:hypothetical protein